MIIVKVGQPKTKNVGDVWFDPTTKVSQRATSVTSALSIHAHGPIGPTPTPITTLLWIPIAPSHPYPLNPNKGDVHVDLIGVPALWDGNIWIPAVPLNYTYPPTNPAPGTNWIESLSQTPYIFFNGVWCELTIVSSSAGKPVSVNVPFAWPVAVSASGQANGLQILPTPAPISSTNQIQIIGPGGPLVTIDTLTGILTYGIGYTPDAAAQIFWRTLAQASPRFLQTRIDDLVKDLANAASRLAVAEGHVLKFTQAGFKLPEPPKPFDPNDSWERAMGVIK